MTLKHPDLSAYQHPDLIVNSKLLGGFAGRDMISLRFVLTYHNNRGEYFIRGLILMS